MVQQELPIEEEEVVVVEDLLVIGPGKNGGSGIVVVRAPSARTLAASPGTNTVTTLPAPAGGCKVATFTVSGDLTIS
jgi:NAD(P)H-hydrate repair Nnr-like enzyme with NAD(P)H-hydrate epimerase domain